MAVPLVVLAIAAINVAGVQTWRGRWGARRTSRSGMALGASRMAVARAISLEVGLLALPAGALSWGIAAWSLRFAANVLPFAVLADARLFLFALALPIAVTIPRPCKVIKQPGGTVSIRVCR